MKNVKLTAFALAAALSIISFGGCKQKQEEEAEIDISQFFDFNQYKLSDEIPDWQGKKLNLIKWTEANSPNSSVEKKNRPDSDVVSPEFERITGVNYNVDESFDNTGGSFDAKVAQMIAAKNFPDVAEGVPEIKNLVEINALWKIDDLLEKYAPNLYKLFGPESPVFKEYWQDQIDNYGGIYELPSGMLSALRDMKAAGMSDISDEALSSILGPGLSPYPYFYMRDDILKKLYPEASTQDEMEELFNQKGSLTLEEMLDVPIDSPGDFVDMLYKIKDLNLKDGTNEVYPIYTHTGSDNWPVLSILTGMFGVGCDYFSYYDKEDHTIKYTFKQDWFKDIVKMYNKWIRDGIASKEALLDTNAIFNEKISNGRYIVAYGSAPNNDNLVGDFKYRKVYARYKVNYDKFLATTYNYQGTRWVFFKQNLSESDMAQILRAFDFAASDPGCKLMNWGPESAGLYTEDENGKLQYKDEELAQQMTLGKGELVEKYGLLAGTWPGRYTMKATKYHPRSYYNGDLSFDIGYNPAYYGNVQQIKTNAACIYSAQATAAIPELNTFWQSRKTFEDALLKVFASTSDQDFENNYQAVITLAEKNGLTDETLAKYDDYFRNKLNKNYMKNLEP
ncbi:MAG: hypothetical protein J6N52_08210 [Clostridia bacterium]|nr:hypothetical protein [Clostridia bacterium]